MENVTPGFLMDDPDNVIDGTGLEKLQILVDNYKHFEDSIKVVEDKLKLLKDRFKGISEEEIPNLLSEFGLSEIKLASGAKITIKEDASVSVKNDSSFFLWLKNRSEDDIIKLSYDFSNRMEDEQREALDDYLIEKDIEFDTNMSVHGQTKKKYFKELLGIGKTDRKEGIAKGKYMKMQELPDWAGVFIMKKTKIK